MQIPRIVGGTAVAMLVACAVYADGPSTRLFPVVSGTVGGRTFRTTVDLRNHGTRNAECRFEFHTGKTPDSPLVSVEQVPPGTPKLLDESLRELPVASAIRVTCSDNVEVYSRIHESKDGGVSYTEGRLFRAFPPNEIARGETRTIDSSADLVVAEVTGKAATVTATFTAQKDGSTATKIYELLPYGQRLIDVTSAVAAHGPLHIALEATGEGRIVVANETRDARLADHARRLPNDQREAFERHVVQQERALKAAASIAPQPSIIQQLLISPFKGAPFQEPLTGLVFMRDRWYDPGTGTFLSPDPEGYADSANPYSYCAGDPVNCSDPTGHLGDGGDLRNDFRMKEQAEAARRHAIWCAQNPVDCRKLEVRGRGMIRMVGGVGQTTAGAAAFASTGPLPEPVTKTLGGTAIVRGIDNTITGAVEAWTGTPRDTVTGRAIYLSLVKSGMSPAQASRITGYTEVGVDLVSTLGSSVVPSINSVLRIRPVNGIIDVGGTSPGASNLNPLLGETGGQTRNVPNLTKRYADQMARYFETGSADQIVSVKLPGHMVNWDGFARGAYTTLRPGGVVDMNLYLTGPAAEQAAIRAAAVDALTRAGFRNVTVTGENVGTILKAVR